MSLSFYDPNDRYRRRAAKRTAGIVTGVFFFGAVFGVGIWLGQIRTQQNLYILQEEKRISTEERDRIQGEMTALRAEAQTANVRLEQLKATYEDMTGNGGMKNLVNLLKKQIDQGIDPNRLEQAILSARPPQNCSDPESKRLVVITPVYSGPSSTVSVGNGAVIISATGDAALSEGGRKEAWFDPGQPITVGFNIKDEEPAVKKGNLPIYHSVVAGDKEYRFTIAAGAKSFAKVTYDFCDYP